METPPITSTDIRKFDPDLDTEMLDDMIETVWADVVLVAPCVKAEEFGDGNAEHIVAVKSVMRDVILRWGDTGSGAIRQRAAGDFSETLDTSRTGRLRPNEIRRLQDLCSAHRRRARASTILTGGVWGDPPTVHPFITDTEGPYW